MSEVSHALRYPVQLASWHFTADDGRAIGLWQHHSLTDLAVEPRRDHRGSLQAELAGHGAVDADLGQHAPVSQGQHGQPTTRGPRCQW
jgi:hypothetical protein